MGKITKERKAEILKTLPLSFYGDFKFKCPKCGNEHIKRIEFSYLLRKDGYNLISYVLTEFTQVCYECIMKIKV